MADETDTLILRVKMLGGPAVAGELEATGVAVKGFGAAAQETGDKEAFAAEKSFLFGESLYSVRRYAFYALTALGAAGGAIVKMGFDFDEARTHGVDALSSLVGGTAQARTEISKPSSPV